MFEFEKPGVPPESITTAFIATAIGRLTEQPENLTNTIEWLQGIVDYLVAPR